MLPKLSQSPTDPDFVQDPYPFYDKARLKGPLFHWDDYGIACTTTFEAANAILRDRRFGREPLEPIDAPPHTAPFYAIEEHSLLQLEPPRHRRLRRLVLRAFTSRKIATLGPEIEQLCHNLIDAFPSGAFDLLPAYATPIPVVVISRLLGVPEDMAPDLLKWSNDMVAMYQARKTKEIEERAARAATEFAEFLTGYIDARRSTPADDLITHLIAAEEDGETLSTPELISTCILLLNAGHEATVHTIGNGVKALIEQGKTRFAAQENTVEEIMRFDPPLHMFTRFAYEDISLFGHDIKRGDEIGCLLAAAARDPQQYENPTDFAPDRHDSGHLSLGAGLHFCVGAPLARLEMQIAFKALFERLPNLQIAETPKYANLYHFHGLERLVVHA